MSSLPSLSPKQTAIVIRKVLRKAFPAAKFSVTTSRGSMVSGVRIRWTDGPTVGAVDAIVGCFQAGHFDGMDDSYKYDRNSFLNVNGVMFRPGTRYVTTTRDMSIGFARRCAEQVAKYWGASAPALEVNRWGGWQVETSRANEHPALNHYNWSDLIHQAAGDRQRFSFQPIAE
jgi:hypothetical protein